MPFPQRVTTREDLETMEAQYDRLKKERVDAWDAVCRVAEERDRPPAEIWHRLRLPRGRRL